VSGHPRRDELRDMISWIKPQILIPAHGEPLHLAEHADLARKAGVPKVIVCKNGDLVKLGPGDPGVIDELPHGRLYKDGFLLETDQARAVAERRRMSFAGAVFVALAITEKGELADDPQVDMSGVPEKDADGKLIDDRVYDIVLSTFESLPRARRRDPDALAESIRRAVRNEVNAAWGKKPVCQVQVLTV
jgi:ribonuclease J